MTKEWRTWNLHGLRVTQLRFDYQLWIILWSLEGCLEICFMTPFTYLPGKDEGFELDPERKEEMAPILHLLHSEAESFSASSMGDCILKMADGSKIKSQAHQDYEAWQSIGSGSLNSASLLCPIGDGSPWG